MGGACVRPSAIRVGAEPAVVAPADLTDAQDRQAGPRAASQDGVPEEVWRQAHQLFPGFPQLEEGNAPPRPAPEALIGRGASCQVFAIAEPCMGMRQVLKCMPKDGRWTSDRMQAVAKEIRLLARLAHPGIPRLLATGHTSSLVSISMEYAGPCNLHYVQQRAPRRRFPPDVAWDPFVQIAVALCHCHTRGVVHRDVKQENIGVSEDGDRVKLLDFGTAGELDECCARVGTVPFMCPEAMGMDASQYDAAAADAWSMGVLLLELLCGLNYIPHMLGWQMPAAPCTQRAKEVLSFVEDTGLLADRCQHELGGSLEHDAILLMAGLLQKSPRRRWRMEDVAVSPWLQA